MPTLDSTATADHAIDLERLIEAGDHGAVARRLGGHGIGSAGVFGFWIPMPASSVSIELLVGPDGFDLGDPEQQVEFERHVMPMTLVGEVAVGVVTGLTPGQRDRPGPLYRALVELPDGTTEPLIDPLAISTPFGAFAPSELLDSESLHLERTDLDYFAGIADDPPRRLGPYLNILQVHVPTATESGTLAGLTRRLTEVAAKLEAGSSLDPGDELWLGYDSIQLMPVEPTIRREAGPADFEVVEAAADRLVARVRRPTTTNWGYDVVIGGSAAVNPAILDAGRPHELAELAETLHTFPTGPIGLVLDVVYGHADNQALAVMPSAWFTGPDMYGQHLDYRNPMVRAQLLEMQRRKANHGVDAIRVDGAQDFTWWDPVHERIEHDDDFLDEMSEVAVEVSGHRYLPWMIFEDGRPWPRDDWEIASTYRAVIERQPHVLQWGPLTFAHNTPFLFTFWLTKWWRLREIAELGEAWISGCANHDTLRRGSQVDPGERINTYLGPDLPAIIERSYDHPASQLLFHGFLPGVPMDFLQATARTPWSFVRNTDHAYAIKVWAEESRFLDWRVPANLYDDDRAFTRLKGLGFTDLDSLKRFMAPLAAAVALHGDRTEPVLRMMESVPRPAGMELDVEAFVAGSHAWMDDVHELCILDRHLGALEPEAVSFGRSARSFRLERLWLRHNLRPDDVFDHLHPSGGAAVFYGLRHGPDGERLLFVANMEGAPQEVVPTSLVGDRGGRWELALASPGVGTVDPERPLVLRDGEGVVFVDR